MLQTIQNKIRRGFSNSAPGYDHHTRLHREIADELWDRVCKSPQPRALLDVGCGTGHLTVKAKDSFSVSQVTGLDFAQGMLEIAASKHKDITWVLGDAEQLPFPDGIFDLVISNLAYQWVGNLTKAFDEARRVLVPGGVFAGTLFGYHTCQELFESLDEAKTGQLQFNKLPDQRQVKEASVKSGFQEINIEAQDIKVQFKDMYELMGWLKSIGANHLSKDSYLGRDAMTVAASIYREKYGNNQGIVATFEVIRVYGKK